MLQEMLNDLGVQNAQVSSWKIDAFATDYLSDDLESDDWRDRWQASWEVHVELGRPIEFMPRHTDLSLASDSTWKGDEPAPPKVMLVADFPDTADMERARQALESKPAAGIEVTESPANERQLLITLAGKAFFEKGAKPAVDAEELCQRHSGTTHWRDRAG